MAIMGRKKHTMTKMREWLATRHLSKTVMGARGKPQVHIRRHTRLCVHTINLSFV